VRIGRSKGFLWAVLGFLVLVIMVGFNLFLASSCDGGNAVPMVSARIIVAGNLALGRSPLSLNISRARSRGMLTVKLESRVFLAVNFVQPILHVSSLTF
jgi:hypothetical protein